MMRVPGVAFGKRHYVHHPPEQARVKPPAERLAGFRRRDRRFWPEYRLAILGLAPAATRVREWRQAPVDVLVPPTRWQPAASTYSRRTTPRITTTIDSPGSLCEGGFMRRFALLCCVITAPLAVAARRPAGRQPPQPAPSVPATTHDSGRGSIRAIDVWRRPVRATSRVRY